MVFRRFPQGNPVIGICLFVLCANVASSQQPEPVVIEEAEEKSPSRLSLVDFEDGELRWAAVSEVLRSVVTDSRHTDLGPHSGAGCEQWIFESNRILLDQRLEMRVVPSYVFDELKTSVWVRTDCQNVRFMLRIRFPNQIDPRTKEILSIDFPGTVYSKSGQWQQLVCSTSDEEVRNRIIRARGQLAGLLSGGTIDTREAYVDQIALVFDVPAAGSVLQIDTLRHGPIVTPENLIETPEAADIYQPRLTVTDDRVMKDDRPFFPVFTLYHGESLKEVESTGVNMLWIEDYADRAILEALDQIGIGAIAQPPQPTTEDAILHRQGIPTFESWTEPIWAWMFGFAIPEDDVRYLQGWSNQVRGADRKFRRPILADVVGQERSFHRQVDFLGSSRFAIHSDLPVADHVEILKRSRNAALPGKPMFTFVQTEALSTYSGKNREPGASPIVEPEQILHQGYAALAAGYKGIGFWKQIPLDQQTVGLDERIHAIRLFALHCRILESWLATGRVVDDLIVRTNDSFPQQTASLLSPLKTRWDQPIDAAGGQPLGANSEIRASVFRCDDGFLILPVWYEKDEQFVPGAQAVKGIRMLLRADVMQAWEVTPTGITQSNLELSRVPGGTEIHLKEFDQQTAIVVTSKPSAIEEIRRACRTYRTDAAQSTVAMAAQKFERVSNVHAELVELAPAVSDAELVLKYAYQNLENARKALAAGHDADAYAAARRTLRNLRVLQRRYWESAVQELPVATASLDATGFQTLPQHWLTMRELEDRTSTTQNLLSSGDFDNQADVQQDWLEDSSGNGLQLVELNYDAASQRTFLRMQSANQGGNFFALTGPGIPVAAGDLVVVSARVRYAPTQQDIGNELVIYDTTVGLHGATHLRKASEDWQQVEFMRKIDEDREFRIRLELRGSGIADVDDLKVRRLE